ncbi:drug:proton antiporter [Boudabousia liubingyangii]|uniref:Drug:proton antiporter n=1 Tax=Boudabousia liubingyangii TaxID=1921764 RepID=A0A1Q5PQ57_9ACTO|nr:geranylgeranyl reductase family protein [Boudabousia liubingyangii]OKL48301.1 drug:proton antiporter [Boudabousia liubingyangii]OKL49663.1 drug:proton antiporter [Boudabousia liubingyangii]
MPSHNQHETDVLIVGAGPAGSSAAHYLAQQGVQVTLVDKAVFPRDKICGDGLTPAAVNELALMGINTDGWMRNLGLQVVGGGHDIKFPWPEQRSLPGFGMARSRMELDEELVRHAVKSGAELIEGVTVNELITDHDGRVIGAKGQKGRGQDAETYEYRARLVVDAGGVAARLATSAGRTALEKRPMAVAARTYFTSPLGDTDWMISHLELWDGKPGESNLLPGYGWIFPLGNGRVNVGLGSVSSTKAATKLPYKQIFQAWTQNLPEEWGFTPENQDGPLRSAALPMCFNRKPQYHAGLAITGDAAGLVSPFNGEGIAPALAAGRYLAQAYASARSRQTIHGFDLAMEAYPQALKQQLGGYYTLGRIFVRLIEKPQIMRACTKYGLPRKHLMKLVHKLLSDGYERQGGDLNDRIIQTLAKVVPSA